MRIEAGSDCGAGHGQCEKRTPEIFDLGMGQELAQPDESLDGAHGAVGPGRPRDQ